MADAAGAVERNHDSDDDDNNTSGSDNDEDAGGEEVDGGGDNGEENGGGDGGDDGGDDSDSDDGSHMNAEDSEEGRECLQHMNKEIKKGFIAPSRGKKRRKKKRDFVGRVVDVEYVDGKEWKCLVKYDEDGDTEHMTAKETEEHLIE